MMRSLRLGLRLTVAGGREGLVRLVFVVAGVAVAVALLLVVLAVPAAVAARGERSAWVDAAYAVLDRDPATDPQVESADGALFLAVTDYHDGVRMTRTYLAALGDDPPVPPGLPRAPGPGEVAVSPALLRLLASTPDDQLDDRFPGRVTMIIGPEGLAHDRSLVAVIGRTPEQLSDVRSVATVHGFRGLTPSGWAITVFVAITVATGSVLVLIPAVLLVVAVSRVAWRQREERLAAIRLVGATRTQTALVAAAESGLGAVVGTVVGWGLYELGRRLAAATVVFQGGHLWLEDLTVPPQVMAGVLVGAPVVVVLTTMASLRLVQTRPLAVQRRLRRGAPTAWRVVPLAVGIGGLVALPLFGPTDGREEDGTSALTSSVVLFTLLTVVGIVLIGPWLVMAVARVIARRSHGLPSLLAARRLAADPYATFRGVGAVAVAALALTYLACTTTLAERTPGAVQLRPGVVMVMTGPVPRSQVEPLLADDVVVITGTGAVACADLQRAQLGVTCPHDPDSGLFEPDPRAPTGSIVGTIYIITDGTVAEENRVRTRAAILVPNAIINTDADPVDYNLETYLLDVGRLAGIAGFFVLLIAAFGLAAGTAGGLIERRRPFALLRASGVHLGELRRTVFLETAATMAITSVAGAAVGALLAFLSARQATVDWRWPDPLLYVYLGGGIVAALLFASLALPLLGLTTRHEAVRYE